MSGSFHMAQSLSRPLKCSESASPQRPLAANPSPEDQHRTGLDPNDFRAVGHLARNGFERAVEDRLAALHDELAVKPAGIRLPEVPARVEDERARKDMKSLRDGRWSRRAGNRRERE